MNGSAAGSLPTSDQSCVQVVVPDCRMLNDAFNTFDHCLLPAQENFIASSGAAIDTGGEISHSLSALGEALPTNADPTPLPISSGSVVRCQVCGNGRPVVSVVQPLGGNVAPSNPSENETREECTSTWDGG